MSPRRKKTEEEASGTPIEDDTETGSKPHAARAPRKKAAAKKAGANLGTSSQEAEATPDLPTAPRSPVNIPIRPIPQISVPPRIMVEPEARSADEIADFWKPSVHDADLSTPPQVLLQRRKAQKQEVEDLLEEPEEDHYGRDREELRPVVRTGLYRKIAIGFAGLAVVVGALVMYAVYARATILIYPQTVVIETEQDLTVAADPRDGDVPGHIAEVTVSSERTEAPAQALRVDGVATGEVVLMNDTSGDQVLIPTTRLLTSDGTLFRLKARANVPAHGRVTAAVYADKPGASGDIGPSSFTIPGLNADLQRSIYAQSEAPMRGGVISRGIISQEDIDRAERGLREELARQAEKTLAESRDAKWTGQAYVIETMNRVVDAAVGDTANGVTVRLTLRVRTAAFDREKALILAGDALKRGLTSERELLGVDADQAEFVLSSADPKTSTASLHVRLQGKSQLALSGPRFDASKLRGLGMKQVEAYFSDIEGVEKIEVKFRPFWLKRLPLLPDRIDFQIQK